MVTLDYFECSQLAVLRSDNNFDKKGEYVSVCILCVNGVGWLMTDKILKWGSLPQSGPDPSFLESKS